MAESRNVQVRLEILRTKASARRIARDAKLGAAHLGWAYICVYAAIEQTIALIGDGVFVVEHSWPKMAGAVVVAALNTWVWWVARYRVRKRLADLG